ncbi:MAG: SCP2 sterol-binding domain-containing protein [Acidimicrobiaceae bacterium]|nr:SCP2 sterol-binding domain-containing protein [Acidimicrobiaceae bacterium]
MPDWLSDEWLDRLAAAVAERPPAPGVTGVVETVIAIGRGKDVRIRVAYKEGEPSWSPSGDAADVTFTVPTAEAQAVLTGDLEPSVGFMRGRIKTSGSPGLVLAWLQSTSTPAWAAWRDSVKAFTDLP